MGINAISHQQMFDARLSVLDVLAENPDCKYGSVDIRESVPVLKSHSLRHTQRLLKDLIESDYIIADNTNPRGYQLNTDKLASFNNLFMQVLPSTAG